MLCHGILVKNTLLRSEKVCSFLCATDIECQQFEFCILLCGKGNFMVYRCKCCGGDLVVSNEVAVCEWCDTRQSIPSAGDEKKVNLFNRANKMRILHEFDKAYALYQSIVSEYSDEAEAYWGLCLCKYGIEYVDDPKTGEKTPTLHRASQKSILDDDDYKNAIDKADVLSREYYEHDAKEINRLNVRAIEIAKNEEPYDIFISYKDKVSENSKVHTKDSDRALKIYYKLIEKGYNVFFSRITLEDKLGEEYEPIIFSALNTSKVMLVIGSKPEYFEAVWVKNEWSRFLALMEYDKSKKMIPCYFDMDPYDLPGELLSIQALDMDDDFYERLFKSIEKSIPRQKAADTSRVYVSGSKDNTKDLVKSAFRHIDLQNYSEADELFKKITDLDPDNYCGWWGRILCLTKNFSITAYDEKTFVKYYDILKKVANKNELAEINQKLFEFFKDVKAATERKKRTANYEKAKSILKTNLESTEKKKETEISTANNYSAANTKMIEDLSERKNNAYHTRKRYLELKRKTESTRTLITVFKVLRIYSIVFSVFVCSFLDFSINGFFIFMAIMFIVFTIVIIVLGNKMKDNIKACNIDIKEICNGRSLISGSSVSRLKSKIEKELSESSMRIESCTSKITELQKAIENNNAVATENTAYLDSQIGKYSDYLEDIETALALPQKDVEEYDLILCMLAYKLTDLKPNPKTFNIIENANHVYDVVACNKNEDSKFLAYEMVYGTDGSQKSSEPQNNTNTENVTEKSLNDGNSAAQKPEALVGKAFCRMCGASLSPSNAFCTKCGTKVTVAIN